MQLWETWVTDYRPASPPMFILLTVLDTKSLVKRSLSALRAIPWPLTVVTLEVALSLNVFNFTFCHQSMKFHLICFEMSLEEMPSHLAFAFSRSAETASDATRPDVILL